MATGIGNVKLVGRKRSKVSSYFKFPDFDKKKISFIQFTFEQLVEEDFHIGSKLEHLEKLNLNYIFSKRFNILIMNLSFGLYNLKLAIYFISVIVSRRGKVLFFDNLYGLSDFINFIGNTSRQYSIGRKWIAGLLTNFKYFYPAVFTGISRHFRFSPYSYAGMRLIHRPPNVTCLLSIDKKRGRAAFYENFRLAIPTVALTSSHNSISGVTFPVFSNNSSLFTYFSFLSLLRSAVLNGYKDEIYRFYRKALRRRFKTRYKKFLRRLRARFSFQSFFGKYILSTLQYFPEISIMFGKFFSEQLYSKNSVYNGFLISFFGDLFFFTGKYLLNFKRHPDYVNYFPVFDRLKIFFKDPSENAVTPEFVYDMYNLFIIYLNSKDPFKALNAVCEFYVVLGSLMVSFFFSYQHRFKAHQKSLFYNFLKFSFNLLKYFLKTYYSGYSFNLMTYNIHEIFRLYDYDSKQGNLCLGVPTLPRVFFFFASVGGWPNSKFFSSNSFFRYITNAINYSRALKAISSREVRRVLRMARKTNNFFSFLTRRVNPIEREQKFLDLKTSKHLVLSRGYVRFNKKKAFFRARYISLTQTTIRTLQHRKKAHFNYANFMLDYFDEEFEDVPFPHNNAFFYLRSAFAALYLTREARRARLVNVDTKMVKNKLKQKRTNSFLRFKRKLKVFRLSIYFLYKIKTERNLCLKD